MKFIQTENSMRWACVLLLVLAVTSAAWAGFIDTDGYYVLDATQLSGFNGAIADGGPVLSINGNDGTISGIQSSPNSWFIIFGATDVNKLPANMTGAVGWKLKFTNTGAGNLNLMLVAATATNGWQQGAGFAVPSGDTGTTYVNIVGPEQMQYYWIVASVSTEYDVLSFSSVTTPPPTSVTIQVDGSSPIRTIPMTMYGGNLMAWDGAQDGTNTTFNNLLKASGRKYLRMPGGSWSDAYLWSDMEGPNGQNSWVVSYDETYNLLSQISEPGETIHPTLQPIVNFPGHWYPSGNTFQAHGHQAAVDAAVAWVQDQSSRTPCAQYWEIGNEQGGFWEEGFFEGISGTYYGDYFADFYLAMKAVNPNINIGACAEPTDRLGVGGANDYAGHWDIGLLQAAYAKGVVPDFMIIHQYPGTDTDASYNPNLLGGRIDSIAQYTSNLNSIIANTLGSQYVGQIGYCMTEWDAGNGVNDTYRRRDAYINAMFHAQYILEMCKHNWEVSNAWAQWEYNASYGVYPVWYIHPLLINFFGRDMVTASCSDSPYVRAYAAKDSQGNLTMFIVNNSPTLNLPANINITGFAAGANGQRWLMEPSGSLVAGGVNIQDRGDISINGVQHPNPLTVASLPPQSFTSGNSFTVTVPASNMLLLKIPINTVPPTVSITSPENGATIMPGSNITIAATASDSDGTVTKVDFYQGSTLLGTDTTSPYSYTWNNVPAGSYILTAKATDNSGAITTSAPVNISVTDGSGTILREYWASIGGAAVIDLTGNANFPNNPTGSEQLTSLEGPTNSGDNYGAMISGYVRPSVSGSYTFWVASDDASELRLSTNDQPANKVLIAQVTQWTNPREWTKYPQQQSSAISLVAGQKYYIEVLHKEGSGGDNIAVAWQGPGITQQVIPGTYLFPWVGPHPTTNNPPTVSITSPLNGATFTAPANITINATASDSDGTVTKVDFYQGTTLLGTDTTSPYSYTWNSVPAGSYTLTAKATDDDLAVTTSAPVNITVDPESTEPTIFSDGFESGSFSTGGWTKKDGDSDVHTEAAYTGTYGARVKSNSWIQTIQSTAGYTNIHVKCDWRPRAAGNQTAIAEWSTNGSTWYTLASSSSTTWSSADWTCPSGAENNTGFRIRFRGTVGGGSAILHVDNVKIVSAGAPANNPPTVSITSPANGATFTAGANIAINATASDSDGTVTKVDFYQGTTLLGTDTTSPYSYTWNTVPAGSYSLTAKATDDDLAVTTSAPVNITVNPVGNNPPTVSITSPANGATFTAGDNVTINATAADSDGTVTKVDFYQGTTLLGTDTTSPYSYTWNSVAAGSYSLTAKATDDDLAVTTSAPVNITVNPAGGGLTMHVYDIQVDKVDMGKGKSTARATVTIVSDTGSPVSGATVTIAFSGAVVETKSGVTNSSGVAVIQASGSANNPARTTGCVSNVTHASYTYDPAANVKTCDNNY